MPALLTSDDKAKIKRHIPQSSNKIITAGIARLYVSFPGTNKWKDTGLTGAIVLAYDEVGKCFFFKLVDVIGNQGILWDQELYDGFHYNQDRTFFHSFELPECMGAFSFAEEREAGNFFAKVESRQKKVPSGKGGIGRKMRGLFGKVDKQDISAPRPDSMVQTSHIGYDQNGSVKTSTIDPDDPEWAGLLEQLATMGISRDQIAGNEEFIKSFVKQKEVDTTPIPRRAPAPSRPQAPSAPAPPDIQVTAPAISKGPLVRNLPPPASASLPPMRALPPPATVSASSTDTSPRPTPPSSVSDGSRKSSAPPPPPASRQSKNKPPPPPARGSRQSSSTPEPPSYAPSIPSKVPLEDERSSRIFSVPPPFEGVRKTASQSSRAPPTVPSRGGPPIPSRSSGPPPVPGRTTGPPPPPTPSRGEMNARSVPPPPSGVPATHSGPPPPPPPPMMSSSSGPPPPPPPAGAPAPPSIKTAVSQGAAGRDDLLASIRGVNSKKLRKTETVDKSAPAVPGAAAATAAVGTGGGSSSGGAAPPTDMASQLAAMLGERNKKVAVAQSDNESDEDW